MRQPVWLNADRTEYAHLRASACSVDLSVSDIPKATLTLMPDQEIPDTHDLIRLYRNDESLGIFRVVSYGYTYRQNVVLQLMSAVDMLNDDVYETEADEAETKTATAWITQILGRQHVSRFTLGSCAMSESVEIKLNYQTLWTLLEEIRQSQQGYMWSVDYSVYPWRLSLVRMPDTVAAAFRVTRNIESAKISITDQDLINKLIFTVSNTDGTVTTITKNNTASQNKYGIRARCTDIKSDELPRGMTADQYATALLNEHAEPVSSIQISGFDLKQITGDDYDHIVLGSKCEAILPGYDTGIVERVVSLSYPDILNDPERVNVQLSTEIKPITGSLAGAKKLVSAVKAVRSGGGGGGGGKADTEDWAKVLTKTIDAVDGTGITELWQSGIVANAQTGVRIFSIYQGMQSMRSELNVNTEGISTLVTKTGINDLGQNETLTSRITQQANRISLVVEGSGSGAAIKAASIVAAINGSASSVTIGADHINLDGYTTGGDVTLGSVSCETLASDTVNTGDITMAGVLKKSGQSLGVYQLQVNGTRQAYFLGTGNVNFDRAAAYDEGWNDCIDACVSHTYLRSYSKYNNGNAVSLWTAPNAYGTQVGPYVWWHGGNETTAYTIPQKR